MRTAIVSTVAVVAGILGLLTQVDNAWPRWGWTTPNRHAQDYKQTLSDIKLFRDEWKCDEWEEELVYLMERRAEGDDSIETARRIERLREKMEILECHRFEDN